MCITRVVFVHPAEGAPAGDTRDGRARAVTINGFQLHDRADDLDDLQAFRLVHAVMCLDEGTACHGDDGPFDAREPQKLGAAAIMLPAADLDLESRHEPQARWSR